MQNCNHAVTLKNLWNKKTGFLRTWGSIIIFYFRCFANLILIWDKAFGWPLKYFYLSAIIGHVIEDDLTKYTASSPGLTHSYECCLSKQLIISCLNYLQNSKVKKTLKNNLQRQWNKYSLKVRRQSDFVSKEINGILRFAFPEASKTRLERWYFEMELKSLEFLLDVFIDSSFLFL